MTKETILIVDDTPTNIRVLAALLADEFEIIVATSGKDALKIVRKDKIDLILLDVIMPDMDGYDVCKQLKENNATRSIPVIFVTALNSSDAEVKGLEMGAVDFITKPFNDMVVLSRVRSHIRLYKQSQLFEKYAKQDGLTQIANRREFNEHIEKEFQRAKRDGSPLSLIMIDIDFFKQYNDTYGHGMGDECLRKVAKLLEKNIKRPGDFLARYGGEEFIVILPQTDQKGGCKIASALVKSINSLCIPHTGSSVYPYVSISTGVATLSNTDENTSLEEFIKLSDNALYIAKNSGRNQSFCHSEQHHGN